MYVGTCNLRTTSTTWLIPLFCVLYCQCNYVVVCCENRYIDEKKYGCTNFTGSVSRS